MGWIIVGSQVMGDPEFDSKEFELKLEVCDMCNQPHDLLDGKWHSEGYWRCDKCSAVQ